jgi:hypothetical protein
MPETGPQPAVKVRWSGGGSVRAATYPWHEGRVSVTMTEKCLLRLSASKKMAWTTRDRESVSTVW